MNIKETNTGKAVVLAIQGRIDSSTSTVLEKKLLGMIDEKGVTKILIDFANMDYINSAGLRVLLMAGKRTAKLGGKVVLSGLSADIKEIFDIAGFTLLFGIYATQDEALRSF